MYYYYSKASVRLAVLNWNCTFLFLLFYYYCNIELQSICCILYQYHLIQIRGHSPHDVNNTVPIPFLQCDIVKNNEESLTPPQGHILKTI